MEKIRISIGCHIQDDAKTTILESWLPNHSLSTLGFRFLSRSYVPILSPQVYNLDHINDNVLLVGPWPCATHQKMNTMFNHNLPNIYGTQDAYHILSPLKTTQSSVFMFYNNFSLPLGSSSPALYLSILVVVDLS